MLGYYDRILEMDFRANQADDDKGTTPLVKEGVITR